MRERPSTPRARRPAGGFGLPYQPPPVIREATFDELTGGARELIAQQRLRLGGEESSGGPILYCAGDLTMLRARAVAVVGSRGASPEGLARARRLARDLAAAGVVVVSGLARGVDVAAHSAAIEAGGRTCAVIGTPLDRAYPAEHRRLQEEIWRHHLLVSPFKVGARIDRSSFPARNKVMAALTDATVIVEASDTSGTLHQAAECARLGRPLFIPRSVASDPAIEWPRKFIQSAAPTEVLDSVEQILERLR